MTIATPFSFYNFDESSGNASDAAGTTTLTNNGTVTYSAGVINNCANISSTGPKYFSATNPTNWQLTGDMSFAGFINFSAFTTNNIVISKWNNTGNNRSYELNITSTTVTFDKSPDGAADDIVSVSWSPSTSTWYHIAMTFNSAAKAWKFYVNATQQGTTQTASSGSTFNGTSDIGVGARQGGTQPCNAKMDMWGAWNNTLSAADITSLYNAGTGIQYPFTVARTSGVLLCM